MCCPDKAINYIMLPKVIRNAYFEQMKGGSNLRTLTGKSTVQYLSRRGCFIPLGWVLSLHVQLTVFLIGATDEDQVTDYR